MNDRLLKMDANINGYATLELKAVEFMPEFVSKLNYYISAVDEYVKSPVDNPTLGLLLCRDKNDKKVELSLRGIGQPMGVARYELEKFFQEVASSLEPMDSEDIPYDDDYDYADSPPTS